MKNVNIYWIDLFAGAGGTSTGIHLAGQKVVACVNHSKKAIMSHAANHPDTIHFTEDIKDFKVVQKISSIVKRIRKEDPSALICLWASPDCTNYSKAKGGKPRDADSRSLANHLPMYLEKLKPDYFYIENVKEFMAWGPLNNEGRPISKTRGRDYVKWIKKITSYGYRHDPQIMNSANYGAYQSRERLFIQFAAKDFPISWPHQTHTKYKGDSSLFKMKRWNPVKEVLDLQDQGKSIFDRKKPLSENTLKRIYAGLEKFVAKDKTTQQFIAKYYSGNPSSKCISTDQPAGTITAADHHSIININYLQTYYGNGSTVSIDQPAPTIRTKDTIGKIDVVFIDQQYGNSKPASIDSPIGTITRNPKFAIVNPQFIMNQYSSGGTHTSIDGPSGTITPVVKQNLITAHPFLINANSSTAPSKSIEDPAPSITQRTHLIINPSWFGNVGSVEQPSCTVIARQDKSPLYLLAAEHGPVMCIVFEDDSETMIKIKKFMVEYCIMDIKMRMLKVPELLQIQGFPKDYILKGTQTEKKKQIGNAVEVNQAKAIVAAFNDSIQLHLAKHIAV